MDNLERKWSLSICIFLLNLDITCIIRTYISNLGTQRVSGITFIRYTESRKIGEPNDFRVLQNFIVVYSLEYKCYIYLRYASFPLISILNTYHYGNSIYTCLTSIPTSIAELDCCQIIILSIYVPSTHACTHVLRLSLDLPYEKR